MKSARWAFDFLGWNPSLSELMTATCGIQSDELKRIGQFVFQKDARSSLVGRLMMRKFVVESLGLSWDRVQLERESNGKPFLVGHSDIHFNVSHQGRFTVLAGEVGQQVLLGTDVMEQKYSGGKPVSEFFRLMNRNFSKSEWSTIEGCSSQDQLPMFFRHWTLKESYVKATGTGITVDLQQINFKINSSCLNANSFICDTELYLSGSKQHDWLFQEMSLDSDHCVAVALCHKQLSTFSQALPQRFTMLSFNDLVNNCVQIAPPNRSYCEDFLSKDIFPKR